MSDFETLKAMMERAQIEYKVDEDPPLTIEVHRGYVGFVAIFTFGQEKQLTNVEAYEE